MITPTVRRAYAPGDGPQVHYREAGERTNPTLLLLHQSPSHSAMYETLMAELADRFHLVAPDTPGFGGSDPLPVASPTVADYATAIGGFMSDLSLGPCFVFGHHTGAAIAVQLEHDFPGTVRAMALSGPPLLDDATREALPEMSRSFAATGEGTHLAQMWERIRGKDGEAPLEISLRETLSALASGEHYHASYSAVANHDFAGLLPAISCPVLVYAAGGDLLQSAVEPTLALLPNGVSGTLPGEERTYVCEKQAAEVAQLLTDFFVKVEQAD